MSVQEALSHGFFKENQFDIKEICISSGKKSSAGLRATMADTKSEK